MKRASFLLSLLLAMPAGAYGTDDVIPQALPQRAMAVNTIGLRPCVPLTGSPQIPVVLVRFADTDFSVASGDELEAYYDRYLNGTRDGIPYTGAGSAGAVRDYFADQSNGAFLPDFVVLGTVTARYGAAYYGRNEIVDGVLTKDVNFAVLRDEVVAQLQEEGIDWARFDNDKDGRVDNIALIYAGEGEATSGNPDLLTPSDRTGEFETAGMRVASMMTANELFPRVSGGQTHLVGMGVGLFCHEFCHVLGLPDVYSVGNGIFCMDLWSVMDYGLYAQNGFMPAAMTAFERSSLGWGVLRELEEPQTVVLEAMEKGGHGCRVTADGSPDEFFVFENRQAAGWDRALCTLGHGLMVTHIDYDAGLWTDNRVNEGENGIHYRLVPANNSFVGSFNAATTAEYRNSLAGNLYPGITGNTELTDDSEPASVLFSGERLGKPVRQIEELPDGRISFKFMPLGRLDTPEPGEEPNVVFGPSEMEIGWPAVAEADWYTVNVYTVAGGERQLLCALDSLTGSRAVVELPQGTGDHLAYEMKAMAGAWMDSEYSDLVYVHRQGTGISLTDCSDETVTAFTLNGVRVAAGTPGHLQENLPAGIYIVKGAYGVRKIRID